MAFLCAGSVILTAVFLFIGIPLFFLFLTIPVVPLLRRGSRSCPVCG